MDEQRLKEEIDELWVVVRKHGEEITQLKGTVHIQSVLLTEFKSSVVGELADIKKLLANLSENLSSKFLKLSFAIALLTGSGASAPWAIEWVKNLLGGF